MTPTKETFLTIIQAFNRTKTPPTLKGGNALVLLYDEPRWSNDLDFDAQNNWKTKEEYKKLIVQLCEKQHWYVNTAKDTPAVTRFMIRDTPEDNHPLKIEISHRRTEFYIPTTIKDTKTYTITDLLTQKLEAYRERDSLRDLQDITYIINHHTKELTAANIDQWMQANDRKPFDTQFDYLWALEADKLSSKEWSKLATDVLTMIENINQEDQRLTEALNPYTKETPSNPTNETQYTL